MSIILESDRMKVELCEQTGAVIGLMNKESLWQAVNCPSMSKGLVIVYRNQNNNYIITDGASELTRYDKVSDQEVVLYWETVSVQGVLQPIQIEIKAKLEENGLHFSYHIINGTNGVVDEIRYPSFGGFQQDPSEEELKVYTMGMNGNFEINSLREGISTHSVWLGGTGPAHITSFPRVSCMQSFELILSEKQGMYIGVHNDKEYYTPFEVFHEIYPAFEDSLKRTAPEADDQKKSGILLTFNLSTHVLPHTKVSISKAIFNMFTGTWHEGVETYIKWRETWYKRMPAPSWYEEVDCWLTLHINSSANCIRYKYVELPEIMREAKKYGVKALQLIGWATGGQDGHEPYQDFDPLLGTFEELKNALHEIREMGIKVLPMCKWRWFDSKYEPSEEFIPYIAKNKFLHDHDHPGYTYQTMGQHLYLTTHDGYQLCHLSKKYRELCLRELDKILALDVDGIMYDEFVFVDSCYSEEHGHRPGQSCWTGAYELAREYYQHTWNNQEALFCGEGVSDYLSQYFPVSYIRSAYPFIPALRYINQEMKFATCLTGFDDRGMVNQCLAYNFIINYEPFHFKGRLSDAVKTGEYGKRTLDLRRKLEDYLWSGRFLDTTGGTLKAGDAAKKIPYLYTVFENVKNKKRAMVVVNESVKDVLDCDIAIENGSGIYHMYTPEEGFIGRTTSKVSVQPRSVVVLVDQEDAEGGIEK